MEVRSARAARLFMVVSAWLTIVVAVGVLPLRWVDSDSSRLITLTVAGPLLTLGSVLVVAMVVVVAMAVSQAREAPGFRGVRALAIAGAGLAGAGMVLYTPADALVGCRPEPAPADAITVVTGNIYYGNNDAEPLLRLADDHDADVLVVPELNEVTGRTLAAHRDRYPYQKLIPYREGANGIGLISRLPLEDVEMVRTGTARSVTATMETAAGPVALIAVHLPNPVTGPASHWKQGLMDVENLVNETSGPVIVAGDFNATAEHAPFRALLRSTGLHDAHDDAGCGWDGTWPTRPGPATPLTGLARIDHVLLPETWRATRVNTAHIDGSDHAAVVATVAPATG
ncbi:MAG: endonuclease/exonuclease/phosphatase family protein [Acidimicrobiales bacterium]